MRDGLVANIDLANHNKESYAYMSNGLVANIMQSYRGLYFRERILCGPPLSCMSDVPPHVEVIGVILSGEDTLQKIIAMQEIELSILPH
jgi:hypothetical protein